jgi:hypothetical protein
MLSVFTSAKERVSNGARGSGAETTQEEEDHWLRLCHWVARLLVQIARPTRPKMYT